MKGLIIKDFKLLKNQRLFLLIMLAVSFALLIKGNDIMFVFSYVAAMFSVLVISTISYDEENNGMGFLMTLPVSRKKYVLEKYIFAILMLAVLLVFCTAAAAIAAAVTDSDIEMISWIIAVSSMLMTASIISSVTIPVQLRFGATKSRVAILLVFLCIIGMAYGVKQVAKLTDMDLEAAGNSLLLIRPETLAAMICILAVLLFGISCIVSVAVMKRKQF